MFLQLSPELEKLKKAFLKFSLLLGRKVLIFVYESVNGHFSFFGLRLAYRASAALRACALVRALRLPLAFPPLAPILARYSRAAESSSLELFMGGR